MIKEDELRNIIAQNIIKYRKANGLTQLDLAYKLHYSDKAISKWERGDAVPDIYTLYRIADLFNIKITDLLHLSEEPVNAAYSKQSTNLLIALISALIIWLGASIIFLVFKLLGGVFKNDWLTFLYAIPINCFVFFIYARLWFNKRIEFISFTGFVLGLTILAYFIFWAYDLPGRIYTLLVGALAEIIVIIYYYFEKAYNKAKDERLLKLFEEDKEDK